MASAAHRELKIGAIIDKALAVLERSAMPALIFLVTLTAVNCVIDYFTWDAAPLSQLAVTPLRIVIGVFFSYNLLKVMIARTGLRSRGEGDVFLAYFGLTILYGLAVVVGLILLVIPALFLMARWSLAQPLVVARGDGVMKAFGQSWERTSGNDFPIIIAVLVLVMIPTAISIAAGLMFEKGALTGMLVGQTAQSLASLLGLSMGVALYGMIIGVPQGEAPAE
jgi:membrane-anchored glycerophosphoryl diester phosphodiesterase (GDPDase)